MRHFKFALLSLPWMILGLLTFAGCDGAPDDMPPLVQVSGIVKMDGSPLTEARVEFTPEKGRGSTGLTDSSGRYTLQYDANNPGAVAGIHKVKIFKSLSPADEKEPVPAMYNEATTLSVTVAEDKKTHDFELKSK